MTAPPDRGTRILEAALAVFGRDGFADGSVDDIARTAGVAKPTVYSRFGDKGALFVSAMALGAEKANRRIEQVIGELDTRTADLRAALERLGFALSECMVSEEGSAVVRLQVSEGRRFQQLADQDRREAHLELLAGKLALLSSAGRLQIPDPHRAARQLMALVTADAIALSGTGTRPLSEDQIDAPVRAGVDLFLTAYGS
ncbi:TetR family transcriptional regulator [Nakamurella sp. YIM 132087]|uniref:TetR family transcriptional regulator n=1 Tax=Nakamurella alba TaxID=2665158 RepID=A0A7K1FR90_9ACTN|nr:TetR/AcrR family transcriptional regulator [Nakamurella alba]MTD16590.1 TetR family transcriptional regulator [Nakamurella alba]